MSSLVSLLFVSAAIASVITLVRQTASLGSLIRLLREEHARCPQTRNIRITFHELSVAPLGGTVLRGRFSAERRRPVQLSDLPAAA